LRPTPRPEKATTPSNLPVTRWIPLGVLLAGLALFFAFGGQHYLKFETLREHAEELRRLIQANEVLAVLGFMVGYAAMTAFSLPGGAVMTVFGGYLFGPYLVTVYVVIGGTTGATVLYLAARTSLGTYLKARAGPFLAKMEAGFQENAMSYLLVLRLVPLFPFWLVNLVPAFLGVSLRTYVVGTFLGIIPGTFVYALVGGGIGALFASGQEPELDILFRPSIFLPLVGLSLLALIPVVYKSVKARRR
jgi:uncharacterized membrane protein YdjX (TVP38/TMEM64 family)